MTGPKLNEGVALAGDRPGTRATAKYIRTSAYKAREVLDLIRGLDARRADEVLQFTARGVAADVRKVLASAVANAVHNDMQELDELFVLACFADEGPTLRRFRPRARGRATRIRKRTCHITVVVARMSDERIDIVQARQENRAATGRRRPTTSAQARRDRVQRSRERAERLREGGGEDPAADESITDDVAVEPGEYAGSVVAPEDGSIPEGFEIKGNANSMKYHVPGGRYYEATIGDVFFETVEHAEAAGFEAPTADDEVVEDLVEAEHDVLAEAAEADADDEADSRQGSDDTQGRDALAGADVNDETKTGEGSASDEPDASEASQQ